jgi:hypothetical protein
MMIVKEHACPTSLTRGGVLGTTATSHLAGAKIRVPHQYTVCTRGQFGTEAAVHAVGSDILPIGVFTGATVVGAHDAGADISHYSNLDDAIRQVAAHEAGHAVDISHVVDSELRHIMFPAMYRGSFLENGIFDDYTVQSKGEFNAH